MIRVIDEVQTIAGGDEVLGPAALRARNQIRKQRGSLDRAVASPKLAAVFAVIGAEIDEAAKRADEIVVEETRNAAPKRHGPLDRAVGPPQFVLVAYIKQDIAQDRNATLRGKRAVELRRSIHAAVG